MLTILSYFIGATWFVILGIRPIREQVNIYCTTSYIESSELSVVIISLHAMVADVWILCVDILHLQSVDLAFLFTM
jgi:hypothetical protein